MTLSPGTVALLVCSLAIGLMVLVAAWHSLSIVRFWDLASGSERQLALERRTYLVSTIVSVFLPLQLFSLFLFVHTADGLSHLFTGAMCAAGTLRVNSFGYPVLLLKIWTFLLAAVWLILNHVDNQGPDYPLIRVKYLLLLVLAPFVVAEGVLQGLYFHGLRPDIITSCCGSLFSRSSGTVASDLVAAPVVPMEVIFFAVIAATVASGAWFLVTRRGVMVLGVGSAVAFLTTIAAVISFISPYLYQLPSHHCPFCLLQREYHYIGYPLYGLLLAGTASGVGAGVLNPFRRVASITAPLLGTQRKLAGVAIVSFAAVAFIAITIMVWSDLNLS